MTSPVTVIPEEDTVANSPPFVKKRRRTIEE
jgi:hypothetical protein